MEKKYKNIYMFKNPIRHFLNVENVDYSIIDNLNINYNSLRDDKNTYIKNTLATHPVSFFIRKQYGNNEIRELKLPNLYNFYILYNYTKEFKYFSNLDDYKRTFSRLKPNLETGDFKSYIYQKNLEEDLLKLTKYDYLYRIDISSFYNTIYTHYLVNYTEFKTQDKLITSINNSKTIGMLMGNYISLFLIEFLLNEIMKTIAYNLKKKGIDFELSNFSDDIYIFSDAYNENDIKNTVSKTLANYAFSINSHKYHKQTYLELNNENLLIKIWKRVIAIQYEYERSVKKYNTEHNCNNKFIFNFLNQLIYRYNSLQNDKLKSIFIKNFFKSNYFIELDVRKYELTKENIHQLFFLMNEQTEIILYVVTKFMTMPDFKENAKIWFERKFKNSLKTAFHEEQIYFYLGCVLCDVDLSSLFTQHEIVKLLIESENQILISYYILNNLNDGKSIEDLVSIINVTNEREDIEKLWFVNYHLIMKMHSIGMDVEKLIIKYLIPYDKSAEKTVFSSLSEKEKLYYYFYRKNIDNHIAFVKTIEEVKNDIMEYMKLKYNERTERL